MDTILQLNSGIGRGQDNNEDDVYATDNALREIGAYTPPPEYAKEPQRYTTEPMVDALEKLQEHNGLKIDGYAKPVGPTDRAINNKLMGKPRGAGLLHDFAMSIGDTVGNGFKKEPRDVETVKRALGGLGYVPEDPFDRPSGFIEESTTKAIKRFQDDNRLASDGWLQPGGETEAALQAAVARLARVKRPEWQEYRRRAPSPDALKGIGYLDDPAEAARLFRQSFEGAATKSDAESWMRPLQDTPPRRVPEPAASPNEGIGSPSFDPNYNFGKSELKRSGALPEGVEPPEDPLKPDVLGSIPREGMGEDDVGTSSKREVRRLISRIYRVGGRDEDGKHVLGDQDFDAYLAAAQQYIKPEHFAVFELTARAVRVGILDSQTAATRLAAYYAPASTGETIVDVLLDLAPGIGQAKAAAEAAEAIERARDAARYGDESAYNAAIGEAALAILALIMPGVGSGAQKVAAKALSHELHHIVPRYLGGRRSGPLLPLTPEEHREGANAIHQLMQAFFAKHYPDLVPGWKRPGPLIRGQVKVHDRVAALDAFYRSLQTSEVPFLQQTYQEWQRLFPEIYKHIRP